MDNLKKTEINYGFLWSIGRNNAGLPPDRWHFNHMQEVVDEPIIRGQLGIDVGSGCGYDSYIMAKSSPRLRLVSMDISDGVNQTRALTTGLSNVQVVRCSVLRMPFKDGRFDFAYSFGVLHHTGDPRQGLLEIRRVIKNDCPAFLYFYEDHSENRLKRVGVKITGAVRNITVKLPHRAIYGLSWFISPFIFFIFSCPAKLLRKFKPLSGYAGKIPFNYGQGLFSLWGDLYDRFSAPVERRFSRREVCDLMAQCGFVKVKITRLRDTAGWVVWGYKRDA